MANKGLRGNEQAIFRCFLDIHPLFAGEAIEEWHQPETDPPDIVCRTISQRLIGVELKTWVHEGEIADKKPRYDFYDCARFALAPQPPNTSENILVVRLHSRTPASRLKEREYEQFRSELYNLISLVDSRWQTDWDRPLGHYWQDFSGHPVLTRHLDGLRFWPKQTTQGASTHPHGQPWILPGIVGEAFSTQSSQDALQTVLSKALSKYDRTQEEFRRLDELYLLVHYDENALFYNSPAETPRFKFQDYASEASRLVQATPGAFDHIFLFVALAPDPRVFQLR